MKRATLSIVTGILLLSGDLRSSAQTSPTTPNIDEPIIISEEPEAFYESAPMLLAWRMKAALRNSCLTSAKKSIFCDGRPLAFLREVSVYGNKKEWGFVCTKDSLYYRNRYYTPADIQGKDTCMWINCLREHGCDMDLERLNKAKDEA